MKKIVMLMMILILISCGTETYAAELDYAQLNEISINEMFTQNESTYYVYFYKEYCQYCNAVKDEFITYALGRDDIYIIDYDKEENKVNEYDWWLLYQKYNRKIGYIDQNGEKVYLPGESEEKYIDCKNMYGKIMNYDFVVVSDVNKPFYPGANVGDIYATICTPEIDYASINTVEDMVIAGVPTLLEIRNHKICNFYFDAPEILNFLQR